MLVAVLILSLLRACSTNANPNAAGEVLLEPASMTGPDPFTASVASPVPTIAAPPPAFPAAPPPGNSGAIGIRAEGGGTVGLYGGTQDNTHCDAGQMARYLAENPGKAAAWVQALNSDPALRWSGGSIVRVEQIPAYLAQLTPVLLRADTRVTNNGFAGGVPTPRQSILQAGSAVLIDTYGVPRARCACGNPLGPPHAVPYGPSYTGPRWPGFSPTTVVVVTPAPAPINIFVLVNINNGTPFNQPAGSGPAAPPPAYAQPPTYAGPPTYAPPPIYQPPTQAAPTQQAPPPGGLTAPPGIALGNGDVQVTLLWTGDSDLDLHVIDPAQQEISWQQRTSTSGGTLDVDQRPPCGSTPTTHVENVFWPTSGAPQGNYQAFVVNFRSCPSSPPAAYELRIKVGGQLVYDQAGSLPQTSGAQSAPVPFRR